MSEIKKFIQSIGKFCQNGCEDVITADPSYHKIEEQVFVFVSQSKKTGKLMIGDLLWMDCLNGTIEEYLNNLIDEERYSYKTDSSEVAFSWEVDFCTSDEDFPKNALVCFTLIPWIKEI